MPPIDCEIVFLKGACSSPLFLRGAGGILGLPLGKKRLSPQGIFPGDDDWKVSSLDRTQLRFHSAVGMGRIIALGPVPGLAFEIIPQVGALKIQPCRA